MGHIDEIGLIVTHIDDQGYLWFRGVGGWDAQILVGQRLVIDTREGPVTGVVGIADKRLGQVPAAVVQLKPGMARPSVAELEAHLRQNVPATHIPVTWHFVDRLPLTPMMKVDRAALHRLFETAKAD